MACEIASNAAGTRFARGVMRCCNCRWWARIDAADERHMASRYGPWPKEKPAGACKRFPPTGLWGAIESARAHHIGESLRTWGDDFCGEFQPDAESAS